MNIDLHMIFQGVTVALVIWVIKGVARINGSVTALITWKNEHNKQDDERHNAVMDWLKSLAHSK